MKIIKHRVNLSASLGALPTDYGVEIDIRSKGFAGIELYLSHDPGLAGESFHSWLQIYKACRIKGPLVINTKEEGLEEYILEILQNQEIENFFFLDTAYPSLVGWCKRGFEQYFSARLSIYEPPEFALAIQPGPHWIWLDCFDGLLPSVDWIKNISQSKKICVVSPELQMLDRKQIFRIQSELKAVRDRIGYVCTKFPEYWEKF
jgi:hypothetical protein